MDFYKTRRDQFLNEYTQLNSQYNTISLIRFLIALGFLALGYYSLKSDNASGFVFAMIICAVLFSGLMRLHTNVSRKRARAAAVVKVNEEEMAYLLNGTMPFFDGVQFTNHQHAYSHDLDIFGPRSLFQNLNRTETYSGGKKLSELLLNVLPQKDILRNQDAIKELSLKPKWRQEIMALGKTNKDNAAAYNKLHDWIKHTPVNLSTIAGIIAIVSPLALLGSIIAYLVTNDDVFSTMAGYLIAFNFSFILGYVKIIKNEIGHTTEIHNIIHHYGLIIEQIEKGHFETEKLKELQKYLLSNGKTASSHTKRLAVLFSRMDIVNNIFGAAVLNGISLFHFHTLKSLLAWKKQHAQNVTLWLDTIAEFEALSSLANLYYNNPDFTFPELNSNHEIKFTDLGHPLISKSKRVGNDVDFNPGFTILTGSNMSGKSTFLRSLGINMVLAGAGGPVCASKAVIHPLPVLVSMRLSDSLSDSESYFFAEIKRLRQIMDTLQQDRAFVLLDEILRGTNSDDKRTGTIKVLRRMVGFNAIGAIATHDIEVCNTVEELPGKLINRCFEVQIVDNELYFDYKLRNGICKNKSATFIMEKMGVV
jgi:DNA mismatch repair ATPase MutS